VTALASAAVVAMTALVAAPAAATLPAPPNWGGTGCPTFLIIGMRGSGESYDGPHGMSTTAGPAADSLAGELAVKYSGATFSYESLNYPAAGVTWSNMTNGTWRNSRIQGTNALEGELNADATNCPATTTMLVGYSQGAAVINAAIGGLSQAALNQVGAVLLIADPYGENFQPYSHYLDHTNGVELPRPQTGGILEQRYVGAVAGRTVAICFSTDPVCDESSPLGLGLTNAQTLVNLWQNSSVHSSYRQFPGVLDTWATTAADIYANAHPPVVPPPPSFLSPAFVPTYSGTHYSATMFANAPAFSPTTGTQIGGIYSGYNYVYCKWLGNEYYGPPGSGQQNYWWLWTDLDWWTSGTGQGWVPAYYLAYWGNDQALTDSGGDIEGCIHP
jgi:cutinase